MSQKSAPAPKLRSFGRLVFATANEVSVRATTPLGTFSLFKIMFGKDGSIYVPFPYLKTKRGVLSEVDPSTEPDPTTLRLRENGVVVDYDAKYSHHTSGVVHFSKTGASDVLPERQSFPLTGPIGRLFWFYAFSLDGFERLTRKERRNELGIAFNFTAHPPSVHVTAEWLRKAEVEANLANGSDAIGPHVVMEHRTTSETKRCVLIGQPDGYALQEHVVMLTATEVPLPDGAHSSTSVFCGGWDEHEGKRPQTARMLVFMYPVT